ncbi:formylglycine-generating enzyme family protein [Chrysiogenes arsenatis]|uniref:formylglycine-generating enzyme family protein n=1 Tax=Chrysiogenes arsenatis TaxID=309797 RepID=UPI0003FA1E85|nr:formylglycine-generating enzyme family protein [Chrysiogenes arsenatis]
MSQTSAPYRYHWTTLVLVAVVSTFGGYLLGRNSVPTAEAVTPIQFTFPERVESSDVPDEAAFVTIQSNTFPVIDGWSGTNVRARQEATAQALGIPVEIRECPECPEVRVIPTGSYTMGSPASEMGSNAERPQHTVTIAHPLLVGKYAITFDEWDACYASGGCTQRLEDLWGRGNQPLIGASWIQITTEYLPWLNRVAGLADAPAAYQYRLLSEAEWEYAARAGTTGHFSFGGVITASRANFCYPASDSEAESMARGCSQGTVAVGSYPPNPWGLYDVHGNVWEFVADCWHSDYVGAPTDGSVWGTEQCLLNKRITRGGAWSSFPKMARSAYRGSATEDANSRIVGFRIARTIPIKRGDF